jgi:ankyrin repeat protein
VTKKTPKNKAAAGKEKTVKKAADVKKDQKKKAASKSKASSTAVKSAVKKPVAAPKKASTKTKAASKPKSSGASAKDAGKARSSAKKEASGKTKTATKTAKATKKKVAAKKIVAKSKAEPRKQPADKKSKTLAKKSVTKQAKKEAKKGKPAAKIKSVEAKQKVKAKKVAAPKKAPKKKVVEPQKKAAVKAEAKKEVKKAAKKLKAEKAATAQRETKPPKQPTAKALKAFCSAVEKGDLDYVKDAINQGISANTCNRSDKSALMISVERADSRMMDYLVKAGATLDFASTHSGDTALLTALRKKDIAIARKLLQAGANPNVPSAITGMTPVMMVVEGDWEDNTSSVIDTLKEFGADVNAQDKNGKTALIRTVLNGKKGLHLAVLALIKHNAKLDVRDDTGVSASGYAEKRAYDSNIEEELRSECLWALLLLRGLGGEDEAIAQLVAAVRGEDAKAFKSALARCKEQNADRFREDGAFALFLASQSGNLSFVDALLSNGVDPNQVAGEHLSTALIEAANAGHLEIVERLLRSGADPNVQNANGMTPLICASKQGNLQMVKKLLDAGAASVRRWLKTGVVVFPAKNGAGGPDREEIRRLIDNAPKRDEIPVAGPRIPSLFPPQPTEMMADDAEESEYDEIVGMDSARSKLLDDDRSKDEESENFEDEDDEDEDEDEVESDELDELDDPEFSSREVIKRPKRTRGDFSDSEDFDELGFSERDDLEYDELEDMEISGPDELEFSQPVEPEEPEDSEDF